MTSSNHKRPRLPYKVCTLRFGQGWIPGDQLQVGVLSHDQLQEKWIYIIKTSVTIEVDSYDIKSNYQY